MKQNTRETHTFKLPPPPQSIETPGCVPSSQLCPDFRGYQSKTIPPPPPQHTAPSIETPGCVPSTQPRPLRPRGVYHPHSSVPISSRFPWLSKYHNHRQRHKAPSYTNTCITIVKCHVVSAGLSSRNISTHDKSHRKEYTAVTAL